MQSHFFGGQHIGIGLWQALLLISVYWILVKLVKIVLFWYWSFLQASLGMGNMQQIDETGTQCNMIHMASSRTQATQWAVPRQPRGMPGNTMPGMGGAHWGWIGLGEANTLVQTVQLSVDEGDTSAYSQDFSINSFLKNGVCARSRLMCRNSPGTSSNTSGPTIMRPSTAVV